MREHDAVRSPERSTASKFRAGRERRRCVASPDDSRRRPDVRDRLLHICVSSMCGDRLPGALYLHTSQRGTAGEDDEPEEGRRAVLGLRRTLVTAYDGED